MNAAQIAIACARAGWRGADLTVAIAVALASSGGNLDRPGGLFGLPGTTGDNSAAAFAKWRAEGWGWNAAHRSGAYLIRMPAAAALAAGAEVRRVQDGLTSDIRQAAGELGDLADTARTALMLPLKAAVWMADRNNWLRVAYVTLGGAMIVAALAIVAKPVLDNRVAMVAGAVAGKGKR